MTPLAFTLLPDRALLAVGGEEAHHFLQNLISCDLESVDRDGAGFGALLTPQGKILFDFLIARDGERYLIDTPAETSADLLKRLTFYRLRAKVTLQALADWGVGAGALPGDTAEGLLSVTDPRLAALGQRHYGPLETLSALAAETDGPAAYEAHRIALGVPQGLSDFVWSDVFPHDADMDQLNGVSFRKGCYVGQEVVSRMQHRSTARKRIIRVSADAPLPARGIPVLAGDRTIGEMGSSSGTEGLALVRLDKARAALDASEPITVEGVSVRLALPEWATFGWPEGAESE